MLKSMPGSSYTRPLSKLECTHSEGVLRVVLVLCEQTNPKYWDDEDAETVDDAYGDDWEKVAAFAYDNVEYSMVKILEPVLILAKEDPVSRRA